jgi:hypothetical protein
MGRPSVQTRTKLYLCRDGVWQDMGGSSGLVATVRLGVPNLGNGVRGVDGNRSSLPFTKNTTQNDHERRLVIAKKMQLRSLLTAWGLVSEV